MPIVWSSCRASLPVSPGLNPKAESTSQQCGIRLNPGFSIGLLNPRGKWIQHRTSSTWEQVPPVPQTAMHAPSSRNMLAQASSAAIASSTIIQAQRRPRKTEKAARSRRLIALHRVKKGE